MNQTTAGTMNQVTATDEGSILGNNNNHNNENDNENKKNDAESLLLLLEQNDELHAALTKQLQYYFSPQNLAKDTYLNTIMELNSGYVPVSILVHFANVNRIIGSFASESASSMNSESMNRTDIHIADVHVANLLRQSALTSPSTLKIVLLNQDGNIVASYGDEHFDRLKEEKRGVTFEAFGRCTTSGENGSDSEENHSGDGDDGNTATSAGGGDDDKKASNSSSSSSSTVILRDVPESATEDDIRGIFEKSASNKSITSPTFTSIQKEVGKCWFVTIDASTSQHDLVSILLDLRSQTICDEPIKARLKTPSATATSATATSTANNNASVSSAFYNNPYHRHAGGRYSGGGGARPHRNHNSYTSIYSGDRAGYYNSSSRKYTSTRPYSKHRGGRGPGFSGGDGSSGGYYNHSRGGSGGGEYSKKNKIHEPKVTLPPPPLVEEHFPGLGIGMERSPKSTIMANHDTGSGESESVMEAKRSTLTRTTPVVVATASGYAAALLKDAAPTVPEFAASSSPSLLDHNSSSNKPALTSPSSSSSSHKPETPTRKKMEDTKSTTTVSTEDCSADDKSSLSSKPESEIHNPIPSVSWGGGRSFADILKKQDV